MKLGKIKYKKKGKLIGGYFAKTFLLLYALSMMVLSAADFFVPDSISVFDVKDRVIQAETDTYTSDALLFGKIPVKQVEVNIVPETKLVPCGNIFGVKFFTKGVIVINLTDIETKDGKINPAQKAGLKVRDIIIKVNGENVNTVEELAACVENSGGQDMTITYERDGNEYECKMKAVLSLSDKKYKTGIWVRDSTAGIGTMTFYNPDTHLFAGLGHGICDVDTGTLMPLLRGSVVDVQATDIIKGRKGEPGELKGSFDTLKIGTLTGNTSNGVYGILDTSPESATNEAISIAFSGEITEGAAYIYSEVDGYGVKKYDVSISDIDLKSKDGKSFVVEITDDELLSKTGGIVQGMSGSPIIQNGKLIGAVTHVLVNDPTRGYGIFIENMLSEAEKIK